MFLRSAAACRHVGVQDRRRGIGGCRDVGSRSIGSYRSSHTVFGYGASKKGRLAAALHCGSVDGNYFGAGFSKIFGSTVGLISIVVTLPLPEGWPAVVAVKAAGRVMPSTVFQSV